MRFVQPFGAPARAVHLSVINKHTRIDNSRIPVTLNATVVKLDLVVDELVHGWTHSSETATVASGGRLLG
jgi:hypothetical protein